MLVRFPFNQSIVDLSVSLTSSATSTANSATHNFSSQAIGDADTSRVVVVAVGAGFNGFGGSQPVANSFTIGGVTATKIAEEYGNRASGDQSYVGLFAASVPSGTSADVNITFNGSIGSNRSVNIGVYALTGGSGNVAASSSVTDFDNGLPFATSLTGDINTTDGGAVIGVYAQAETSTSTVTWSGLTEDVERGGNAIIGSFASSAITTGQTPRSISMTSNDTNWGGGNCLITASWDKK